MSPHPTILGIYSQRLETSIGSGNTHSRRDTVTYWYVRQTDDDTFEVQPLNAHHIPSGVRTPLAKIDFLRQYTPEPSYYALHTVPALASLARKVEAGEEAFARGDMDEAERQFIKALMIHDLDVGANYGLGEVYSETKNFLKLKQVLNTLLCIPEAFTLEHRQRFNAFGISLRKNGHYDESIRYYEKSLEFAGTDENVYFNLARVLYEKGELDKCMENLRMALKLNPDFEEARKFMRHCEKPDSRRERG
jgi:tetratricopeptide (TPR) repeat protein